MSAALADKTAQTLETARADLARNETERQNLQRKAAGAELGLALRDLKEGLRGMIRVSPLVSVFAAAVLGAAWARRRPRRLKR